MNLLILLKQIERKKKLVKTQASVIINPPQKCDNRSVPEVGLYGTSVLPDNKMIASSVFLSSRCLACKHSACLLVNAYQQF